MNLKINFLFKKINQKESKFKSDSFASLKTVRANTNIDYSRSKICIGSLLYVKNRV